MKGDYYLTKLTKQNKVAIGLLVGFLLFYFGSAFVYAYLLNEGTFVDQLLFTGSFEAFVLKVVVLLEFAVFAAFFFNAYDQKYQAEKTLGNTEKRWASTLAGVGEAVILTEKSGKIIYANDEADKLTGWNLTDIEHQNVKQIFKTLNNPTGLQEKNPVTSLLETGKIVNFATTTDLIRKDGVLIPISGSAVPIRDEDSNLKEIALIFRDVSEQKIAYQKLIDSKEFNQSIIDAITDPIYVIDPKDYRILAVNDEAAKTCKLSKQELIGKTCYEMTHFRIVPCEGPQHICPLGEVVQTKKPISVIHTHFDDDKNEIKVQVSLYPILDHEQNVTRVVHIDKTLTNTQNNPKQQNENKKITR